MARKFLTLANATPKVRDDLDVDLLIARAESFIEKARRILGEVPDSSDVFEPWQALADEVDAARRARSRGDLIGAWTHANVADLLTSQVRIG